MSAPNNEPAGPSAPPPEPMDTSSPSREIIERINIIPISNSVATNDIDAVLESNSLMTTKQAYDLLRDLGVPRDIILGISQYGLDESMKNDSSQYQSQEEKDVQDLVSLLSQTGWRENYPEYIASTSQPRPPNPKLLPMIQPIHYNDLDPNILRYAPHLRPGNIIPPMAGIIRQHPQTLQVSRDPDAKGFSDRDPNVVILYIVGPPGSGKTEVAKAVCERFNFHYLGVADILEQERQNPQSPYRDILEDMLPKGLLGPYKMVPSMLISQISQEMSKGFKQVFVIDGFPRGLDRAQYFESILQPCDQLIELLCDDEIAFSRMMMAVDPSTREANQEELTDRFKNRLKKHRKEVAVVTHYYRQLGKVMTVDAEVPFSKVMKQMELKMKDLTIDGFVGNRKETVDERNKKAWQEMKIMVERQFMKRAYSYTALAARGGYDPTIDDSGSDEEMDDFEGEEGVEEERRGEEGEDEEDGGVPLDENYNSSTIQQATESMKESEDLSPSRPVILQEPDNTVPPTFRETTSKSTQDTQDLATNQTKIPEKTESVPNVISHNVNSGASFSIEHSSDELESDSGMRRTKNAGKTPGPKQTQNFSRSALPSDEPSPSKPEEATPQSHQQTAAPESSSFAKRLKSIRRKISGTFSTSSENGGGTSTREKIKAKLSFPSMGKKKKVEEGGKALEESEVSEGTDTCVE
ncbi:adenylate kinase [Orbilia javanica]|uniref:Adenylate kinase n=1 Tax=Orbilia javanica TaxID=47235 RepID=A0AAN8MZQ6_9PEZI